MNRFVRYLTTSAENISMIRQDLDLGRLKLISCFTSGRASALILEKFAQTLFLLFS